MFRGQRGWKPRLHGRRRASRRAAGHRGLRRSATEQKARRHYCSVTETGMVWVGSSRRTSADDDCRAGGGDVGRAAACADDDDGDLRAVGKCGELVGPCDRDEILPAARDRGGRFSTVARGEAARSGGCAPRGVGRFRYPRGSRAATRRGVVTAPPGMTTIAP